MFNPKQLQVYFICGTQDVPENKSIEHVLDEALEAGITMFQFREKGPQSLKGVAKKQLAMNLKKKCELYKVPFIVNDDVDLAIEIDANGVHVGQDDEKIETFSTKFKDKIIGLSIGNVEEYKQSDLTHVNYIGVGPMFTTTSKDDAHAPVGPEMISQLRHYVKNLPIVAIGGINETNINQIAKTDVDGVSVISAIARSSNIDKTVKDLLSYFN